MPATPLPRKPFPSGFCPVADTTRPTRTLPHPLQYHRRCASVQLLPIAMAINLRCHSRSSSCHGYAPLNCTYTRRTLTVTCAAAFLTTSTARCPPSPAPVRCRPSPMPAAVPPADTRGRQPHPQLIAGQVMRAQPVGLQVQRLLCEGVLHLPACTAEFFVQPGRRKPRPDGVAPKPARRQVGYDKARVALIVEASGQCAGEAERAIDIAQQESAAIGGERAA